MMDVCVCQKIMRGADRCVPHLEQLVDEGISSSLLGDRLNPFELSPFVSRDLHEVFGA